MNRLFRTVLPGVGFVVAVGVVAACSSNSDSQFGGENGSSSGASGGSSSGFGSSSGGTSSGTSGSPGVDVPHPPCDSAVTGSTAEEFAKAIGVCDGLVKAEFTRGYNRTDAPQAEQHGVLTKFGNVIKPREGAKLGVLSTGYAREYDGTGGTEPFGGEEVVGATGVSHGKDWYNFGRADATKKGNGTVPPGFPKPASGCQQAPQTNDVINLKLTLKAPADVSGFKFDFNFYSGEWPAYICSPFNDGFIAYLTSKGLTDNVSFDAKKNPVSVNNGFFDRCTPNVQTGCGEGGTKSTSQCPGGADELGGTGFGVLGKWCSPYQGGGNQTSVNGGATGWLTTQAPISGGEEFTIEFMIWDTGDAILDSSVLIDNFRWAKGSVTTGTDRPPR
jgi:hypothetical protein